MRAAVSSGLSGVGPDNWRPRSEFLTGQEEGWREDIGNEKRKGGNKQKASQKSQWCGGKSTGARPKSRGGSAPWPPSGDRPHSAGRVFWSTWAGAVVSPCLREPGPMFRVVQYQKFGPRSSSSSLLTWLRSRSVRKAVSLQPE